MADNRHIFDPTMEFARRDDCLDRMVPSDLRQLIGERDRLRSRNEQLNKALHGFVEGFDEWDDDEEPETSEAAMARNERVRVYRRGKNALSTEPEEEGT